MGRTDSASGTLWAITAYFNPSGYEARRSNFRIFRQHLAAPLVAVELSFGGDFELGENEAEILIRVGDGDVMWQKERLLNIALKALPPHVRYVAWLDSDVVFESDAWVERTAADLGEVPLVQPYTRAFTMPRGWRPGLDPDEAPDSWTAVTSLIDGGMPLGEALDLIENVNHSSYGYAWAARRDLLDAHGFYDLCIMGGGDTALARAAYGRPEETIRIQQWDRPHADHYLNWARPFSEAVRGKVRAVEGTLYHLWHGSIEDRRYWERYLDLKSAGFDVTTDVALSDTGVWRWASDKPGLHSIMRSYFDGRREDG
jgi:hypothetical protein